jgi:hypothetical protein
LFLLPWLLNITSSFVVQCSHVVSLAHSERLLTVPVSLLYDIDVKYVFTEMTFAGFVTCTRVY